MAQERIDIVVSESGSRTVVRNINEIGGSSDRARPSVDALQGALKALFALLAADKIKQYADAWSSADGLIKIATKTHLEAVAVQERLFAAAQKTRQEYGAVVELYSASSRAASMLGASQEQLIQFTEGVGRALAVQHVSTEQASGALLQLGQLLDSGRVRGQEFNAILMSTPTILQTVARGMGRVDGNVSELRKKMLAGQLTSKEFFDAFLKGMPQLEADFNKSNFTIGQGLTIISNSFEKFIGQLYESTGAAEFVGKAARFIAENMKQIASALVAVAVAAGIFFVLPAAIGAVINVVRTLFLVIMANPFVALAAAIAGVITYLGLFGDEMNAGIDKTTTVKDVLRALAEEVVSAFQAAKSIISDVFGSIVGVVGTVYADVTGQTENATASWMESYHGFFADTRSGFAGVLQSIARTVDAILGLLMGVGHVIANVFTGLPALATSVFGQFYNNAVVKIEQLINRTIDGLNKLRSLVGASLIDSVKLTKDNVDQNALKTYGQHIADGIDQGFQSEGGFVEKWLNGVFDRAQEIGKKRAAEAGAGAAVDLTKSIGAGGHVALDPQEAEKEAKALERLQNHLRSLLNTIYPSAGAVLELKKAQETLTAAVQKHLITQEQADKYMELAKRHYQDLIDPLGKLNRELDQQTNLLRLSADARAVESQIQQTQEQLLSQGIILTQKETEALREKLQVQQELAKVMQFQDQFRQNSYSEQAKNQGRQNQAIGNLLADPSSGYSKADGFRDASAGLPQDVFKGTKEAAKANQLQYKQMYAQIDAMRQQDLISEGTAIQAKIQLWNLQHQQQIQAASDAFGNLATLQNSHNKKAAAIGKAAAIAQATINTYQAATGAYAAMASIPYVGPFLGAAAAAAAVIAGLANIAQIKSANYGGYAYGGSFEVGGIGGTDSQMVSFRATPGERVSINTPSQAQALEDLARQRNKDSGERRGGFHQTVNVVVKGKPNRKTPEQEARAIRRETMKEYSRS